MAHSMCLGVPDGQGPDQWGWGERQDFCKKNQWEALSTAGIFKASQSIIPKQMEYNAGEFSDNPSAFTHVQWPSASLETWL